MEALFCFRQQFFCLMAAKIQGQPQKPRQLSGHIGPEFPQGPQQRRSRQQIQQHPRPGSQQQIQLRLAAACGFAGPTVAYAPMRPDAAAEQLARELGAVFVLDGPQVLPAFAPEAAVLLLSLIHI